MLNSAALFNLSLTTALSKIKSLTLAISVSVYLTSQAFATDPPVEAPPPHNPYEDFTTTYLENIPTEAFAWAQMGIKDYAYSFSRLCFCTDAGVVYNVNVRDHKVAAAYNSFTGMNLSADELTTLPTINEMHVQLLKQNNKAHKIEVTYDSRWHYPKKVYIDIHPMIADEEISYKIGYFAPIEATAEPFSGQPPEVQ